MSANLDLVRSIYADWGRGDLSGVAWAHSDIQYVIADGPAPGSWTGLAGMAEAVRDWLKAWEDIRFVADEYRELDGRRVLALHHFSGRGKASGLEVGRMWATAAHLFHIRDRKVTRLVLYHDRDRALADLGMEK